MAKHLRVAHDQNQAFIDASYQSYKIRRPELFGRAGREYNAMDLPRTVRISLSADNEEHDVQIEALVNAEIDQAVILESSAHATRARLQPLQQINICGPHGEQLVSSASITLRWNHDGGLQTFQQTFFVVKNCGAANVQAVIGKCSPPPSQQPKEAHVFEMRPESKAERAMREKKDRESQVRYQAQVARERQLYLEKVQGAAKSGKKR